MQVLVVMAGKGQRFIDEGYVTPKPMIDVVGKTMVRRTIESLPYVLNASGSSLSLPRKSLSFAVLQEHIDRFAIDEYLYDEFGSEINVISMPSMTRGNLETAYNAIREVMAVNSEISEDEMFLVLDSDNVYTDTGLWSWMSTLYHTANHWGVICVFDAIDPQIHWCFAELDEDNPQNVEMLHEKTELGRRVGKPMVGTFAFSSIGLFLTTATAVLKFHLPASGEYYMSQAMSHLLNVSRYPVYALPVTNVRPMGTPTDLALYRTYLENRKKLRICFDLDDTILHCKAPGEEYGNEKPQLEAIETIQKLHEDGHYIIIYTARHMNTCDGNVGKVLARQGLTTLEWLSDHEIPYDEIYFGKPHADIFVDDKAYRHDGIWENVDYFIDRFIEGEV